MIQLLEERETIMTIFPQVHMHSLQNDVDQYTIDPKTRYKGLRLLKPRMDVKHLYDTDTLPKAVIVGRAGKLLLYRLYYKMKSSKVTFNFLFYRF